MHEIYDPCSSLIQNDGVLQLACKKKFRSAQSEYNNSIYIWTSNSITASYPVDIVHLSKLPFSVGHASLDLWPDWCLIGPGAEGELKLSVYNLQGHEIVSIIESAIVEKQTIFHLSCKPLKKNQLKWCLIFIVSILYIFFCICRTFQYTFYLSLSSEECYRLILTLLYRQILIINSLYQLSMIKVIVLFKLKTKNSHLLQCLEGLCLQ